MRSSVPGFTRRRQRRHSRSAIISIFSIIAALLLNTVLLTPARADNPPRKILSGWIPYYSIKSALPAALANPDLVSEVTPFWYTLKDAQTIQDNYTPANPNLPIAGTIAQLQAAGYLVLPTITDGTSRDPKTGKSIQLSLSNLLADPVSEKSIVSTITSLVTTNKYDGIDLDLESFAYVDPISTWSTTQIRWVAFIKDLSSALHTQGKLLSITTPPLFDPVSGKKGYYLYAWADVSQAIDRLRIMAYDYSTSSPGPIGPITWTESAVQYAVSVMPASKVYIGVPGYGRDWVTKVDGTCPSLPINYFKSVSPTASAGTVVMHDVANLAASYNATPSFNDKYGESTFTYQKPYNGTTADGTLTTCTATRTVWYQDAKSFSLRAGLVAKYHLGGIAEWTFGMEDPTAVAAVRMVATAIGPDPVVANLAVSSTHSTVGDLVTVNALLKKKDTTPFAGVPSQIEIKTASTDWTVLFTANSAADGSLAIPVIIGENSTFRVGSAGSWERLPGASPEISVGVTRTISWRPPTSMKRGIFYSISGQIQPKVAGIVVQLDEGVNASADLRPTAITDGDGSFTIRVAASQLGLYSYQVLVPADSHFVESQSDLVTVVVR